MPHIRINAEKIYYEKIRGDLLHTDSQAILGDFLACHRFDIMNRLKDIRLPTLIISGENDMLTPPKYSEFLCSQMPNAVHRVLKDAGHMMAIEKNR